MLAAGSAAGDAPSQDPVHPHPVSDFVQLMMLLPNPPDADHAFNTYSSTTLHGLTTVGKQGLEGSGKAPSPLPHHASAVRRQ